MRYTSILLFLLIFVNNNNMKLTFRNMLSLISLPLLVPQAIQFNNFDTCTVNVSINMLMLLMLYTFMLVNCINLTFIYYIYQIIECRNTCTIIHVC